MTTTGPELITEPFELSGGALCLDYANTWGNQADPASDRLTGYTDLLAFSRQTRSLPWKTIAGLSRAAGADTKQADNVMRFAREFRGAIYRLFSNRAAGFELPQGDIDRINAVLGEAMSGRRLQCLDAGCVWNWEGVGTADLRAPLWPVVESAAALLTSGDISRIGECDASDCNWLFLDRSRAGTRRWCSMSSCGNRAKARRHYRKKNR